MDENINTLKQQAESLLNMQKNLKKRAYNILNNDIQNKEHKIILNELMKKAEKGNITPEELIKTVQNLK